MESPLMPEQIQSTDTEEQALEELAYYYPEPFWQGTESGAIKSLLLFFNGVAILLPRYMRDRPAQANPSLVEPLEDQGLLRVLEPEEFVDKEVTDALSEALVELITGDVFEHLDREGLRYQELSRSRLGWNADVELAEMVIDELIARDLARPTEDGVSVPLHPVVRRTVLVMLAQLARGAGRKRGLDLQPTTTRLGHWALDPARALSETVKMVASQPSTGGVVAVDLETVAVNLDPVPLDEVLDFRHQHQDQYRAYARNVREMVRHLSLLPAAERTQALEDRQDELADQARQLRRTARRAWRLPLATFSLGALGAAWQLGMGHPVPAALQALGGLLGSLRAPAADRVDSAYSYLFEAHQGLG